MVAKADPKGSGKAAVETVAGESPQAVAALNDQIAVNRTVKIVPAEAVPGLPLHYKPVDPAFLGRALRKVDGNQESEANDALVEAVANAASLKKDLGEYVPEASQAEAILVRVKESDATINVLRPALVCAEEIKSIALSDTAIFLDALNDGYQHHVAHKPELKQKYRALDKYFAQKSAAISEGIAHSKAQSQLEALVAANKAPKAG